MPTKANKTSFKKGNIPWNKGKKTGLIPKTAFKKGKSPWNKNKAHKAIRGKKHYRWKGGFWINKAGYKIIEFKRLGEVFREREHRLIMEEHLGRRLKEFEDVHHINGDKLDNRIENLELMTKSEHAKLHQRGGDPY